MIGVMRQGMRCAVCNQNVHKKCVFKAQEGNACGGAEEGEKTRNDGEHRNHQFDLVSFTRPTSCALCLKFIWGLHQQGYACSLCAYPCHPGCLDGARETACILGAEQHRGAAAAASLVLETQDVAITRNEALRTTRQNAPIFLVPIDVLVSIMARLCIRDVLACSKTCRFLLAASSRPELWPDGRGVIQLRQAWLSLNRKMFKADSGHYFDPEIEYLSGIAQLGETVIVAGKRGHYLQDSYVKCIDSPTGSTEHIVLSMTQIRADDPRGGGFVGWGGDPNWEAIHCVYDGKVHSWDDNKKRFNSILYRHPYLVLASAFWEHERNDGGDSTNSLRLLDVVSGFATVWRHDFDFPAPKQSRNEFLAVESKGVICSCICGREVGCGSQSFHPCSSIMFHSLETGQKIADCETGPHTVQRLTCSSSSFIALCPDMLFLFNHAGQLLRRVPTIIEASARDAVYHTERFFCAREGKGRGYDSRGLHALVHAWDAATLEPLCTIDKSKDNRSFHSFGILEALELVVIVTTGFCKYDYTLELYSLRTGCLLHVCPGLPCNQNSVDGPDSNVVMTPHALWLGEGGRGGKLRMLKIPEAPLSDQQCSIQ